MDEYLWPARNVAEYAYCPRLFYIMEVEGVFLPSADTEKGAAIHARTDKPTPERDGEDGEDPDRPKAVRKLTLSSTKLGLTAVLDIAEISGDSAVPIEYRKGRPKRVSLTPPPEDPDDSDRPSLPCPEPWPTDRIQVGFQAILLEEAGYRVPKAILYYASEKLRLEVPVDDALKSEAMATLEAARKCAAGPRPPPLINDPRCVRCSLQPICLPDEINLLKTQEPSEELTPRKIWPPLDGGIHVVAAVKGAKIGVRGMTITVTDPDGAVLREIPLVGVESLSLLGPVQLSTQAIHALADRGVPVAWLSAAGRPVAILDPLDSVSAAVRRAQVLKLEKEESRLDLAKALIAAKIANQRTMLMRNIQDPPAEADSGLAAEIEGTRKAESIEAVRGHEGRAAAVYFAHFAKMFKGKVAAEFDANGRQRRPPPDPINACLSLAYSMLTHECTAALRLARLEPSIGAYHVSRPGRPALALDLMEPFRPIIADSIAVTAFNRGELTENHFQKTSAGCVMTGDGRRAFFYAYGRRMDTEVTHPVFEYRLSYRRMLVLHARMIAAWMLGEISSLSFLTTR